jgi:thioredoxin 1
MSLQHVDDETFESEVLKSEVPVLVDFYATWCGPCKAMEPSLAELATEYEGRAKIVKVNIEDAQGLASSHGIMAVPTLIMFKNGAETQKLTGRKSKPELEKTLLSAIG